MLVAGAQKGGFDALYDLRKALHATGIAGGTDAQGALRLGHETFLPWCKDPTNGEKAVYVSTLFATLFAAAHLLRGEDPRGAVEVLAAVWPFRDPAQYHACELSLYFAEACRLAGHYTQAEEALDFYQALRSGDSWRGWKDDKQAMLAVHNLQYECRRAQLELSLGNPQGMRHHLRLAAALPAPKHAQDAWARARAQFVRDQIDCYFATDDYDAAIELAERATTETRREVTRLQGLHDTELDADERAVLQHRITAMEAEVLLLRFYLAMGRSWSFEPTDERYAAALAELEFFANSNHAVCRRQATVRLMSAGYGDGQPFGLDGDAGVDARAITAATAMRLGRDTHSAADATDLSSQQQQQRAAFDELMRHWRNVPRRDGGVGFLHFLFRRETIVQLVAITLRTATPAGGEPTESAIAESLRCVMEAQALGSLGRELHVTVPDAAALQALLGPRQGVLLFLPGSSQTHVFAISANRLVHDAVPASAPSLRPDIQHFLGLMRRATGDLQLAEAEQKALAGELRAAGYTLTDALLSPSMREELATWKCLTVIGSELLHGPVAGSSEAGFLNYLPIECLPWNDSELFGEHFAIDHNSSLPVWAHFALRGVSFDKNSSLRLFAGLRRTDAAAGTSSSIEPKWVDEAVVDFDHHERFIDAACLLRNVAKPATSPTGKGASIAVFLNHGGYDASDELGSFLQLLDGRLDCRGVRRLGTLLTPFADLVVLAACRAGKGPSRPGDNLANLGGAFMQAGATAVVQSRFDLPLHQTQALLTILLHRLSEGDTVAESMRAARTSSEARGELDAYRTGALQVHGFGQARPRR